MNMDEQMLMAFVILKMRGSVEGDLARWMHHLNQQGLSSRINETLALIGAGELTPGGISVYDKADIFLLRKLEGFGGSFGSVRGSISGQTSGWFKGKVAEDASAFLEGAPTPSEISLSVKIQHFNELLDRFGPSVASAYLRTSSALLDQWPVFGLGGLLCYGDSMIQPMEGTPCEGQECVDFGATIQTPYRTALSCIDPTDLEGGRIQIYAIGKLLMDSNGIMVHGYRYPMAIDIDRYYRQ